MKELSPTNVLCIVTLSLIKSSPVYVIAKGIGLLFEYSPVVKVEEK